ncbi:MAG: carbohydrate kinase family protein [Anaerolineae bacterium]|nr:carbohydrate kinase family protein [Anaerolineae bacterium]
MKQTKILVAGLVNLEVTLRVEGFPIDYSPVRYPFFGVNSSFSGVGLNVARALVTLGQEIEFLSLIGKDWAGHAALAELEASGIPTRYVLPQLANLPHSVILYEGSGRRQINTDLKDIQDQVYPVVHLEAALQGCHLAAICNINFARPFLEVAQAAGVPIATDVHVIRDLDDPYNRDYMAAATLLFMSNEGLPCPPEEWALRVQERYQTPVIVIGLGREGALLVVRADGFLGRFPALYTRLVQNSVGAGDALFSAFVHCYAQQPDPYRALQRAQVFASYKIGAVSGSDGFLSAPELDTWCQQAQPLA